MKQLTGYPDKEQEKIIESYLKKKDWKKVTLVIKAARNLIKRKNRNMDKFSVILNSINWVFAGVILIGGRYWGSKYFRLSKSASLNFLGFATTFAVIYLGIIYWANGIDKNQVANLFITYLVTTSFYELIAARIFELIEGVLGKKKEPTPLPEAVTKYEAATGEKVDTSNFPDTSTIPGKPD